MNLEGDTIQPLTPLIPHLWEYKALFNMMLALGGREVVGTRKIAPLWLQTLAFTKFNQFINLFSIQHLFSLSHFLLTQK